MAENIREIPEQPKIADSQPQLLSGFHLQEDVDKEARLRSLKERQNEERQRKLEEIKAQALAAQRFKEQKEQERRRRLEEMRMKDDTRRHQVEERKRAINEAERDRLESILRRNQEREARIEAKKRNERSSVVFAFGSSTPRMLDPVDVGVGVSFWGHRRATSTQNITATASTGASSLTRRQSERELDSSSKKRATSAGGLERSGESITSPTAAAGCASGYLGRRRTDLVPTIPSRDSSFHSSTSRKSLNHSPGRAYSMSRLDQLAKPRKPLLPALNESNLSAKSSVTRSMSHLAHVVSKTSPRKRLDKTDSRSMHQLSPDRPVAPPRVNRATQLRQQKLLNVQPSSSASEASSRPSSSMSQQSANSMTASVNLRHRISNTPRRPRPVSIAVTGVTYDKGNADKGETRPPLPKTRKSLSKTNTSEKIEKGSMKTKSSIKSPTEEKKTTTTTTTTTTIEDSTEGVTQKPVEKEQKIAETVPDKIQVEIDNTVSIAEPVQPSVDSDPVKKPQEILPQPSEALASENPLQNFINNERNASNVITAYKTAQTSDVIDDKETKQEINNGESSEMTTSMSKPRITTEEEAKAALAERRRLIREEAERQAELERQRIEAEQKAELERQQKEEEQARLLAEMQRQAEQERLQEAIREAQRREEEERIRREEELRQKLLKEEADRKAKEEAEKQKAELQKKLENEEKEREERRKRVEMIMSRTRGKANANLSSQQSSQDKNENTSEIRHQVDQNKLIDENKTNENLNGTKQENGTTESSNIKNGKDVDDGIVDNLIPDESVKNANTVGEMPINTTTDSLNSNSGWQASSQQFLGMS